MCSSDLCPFPIKSLALSAHVSPRTIHFRVLDKGKLKPVEVVKLNKEKGVIQIETDTGDTGRGETIELALRELKETTPGTIYLDTAEYVLLPKQAEELINQLSPHVKQSVRICYWEGEIDLKETTAFLDAHRPRNDMKHYKAGMPLQTLSSENGVLKLNEKTVEKS